MTKHNINDLLTSDIEPRFPNLREIEQIDFQFTDYEDSLEMIKIAIRSTNTLTIRILDGDKEMMLDILKYLTLLGNIVKRRLYVNIESEGNTTSYILSIAYDKILFVPGNILSVQNDLDLSYLDVDKIVLNLTNITRIEIAINKGFDSFIRRTGISKVYIAVSNIYVYTYFPDIIDTLYLPTSSNEEEIKFYDSTIHPNIKHIYLSFLNTHMDFLKMKFPKAEFHFIDV